VYEISADGTEKVLYSFKGGKDGLGPVGSLILDKAGDLYGTTEGNGAPNYGTIFKLMPAGKLKVLYTFNAGNDGAGPTGPLLADKNGNLFGVTTGGGGFGYGTAFALAPNGTETQLHVFMGGSDGGIPAGGLVTDSAGNLYGTAFTGGIGNCEGHACGVVFKIAPDGTETIVYAFRGGADGSGPYAGLLMETGGDLYGTTRYGGNTGCNGLGCGVVFKLTPAGSETVLYTFTGGTDGANPCASLIADKSGNLLGTAEYGGANGNGVIFSLAPRGTETVLYDFTAGPNGRDPTAPLTAYKQSDLFGTATLGGYVSQNCVAGCGTVFKIEK
jgi:uncharacterized repeat protein (TIGR03803 family)